MPLDNTGTCLTSFTETYDSYSGVMMIRYSSSAITCNDLSASDLFSYSISGYTYD